MSKLSIKHIASILVLTVFVLMLAGCSGQASIKDGVVEGIKSDVAGASTNSAAKDSPENKAPIILEVSGASFTLPEGFKGTEAASKYDPSYYYAEKGGGKVVMIMTQATQLEMDSTTDYQKLGDDVLDGLVSSAGIQEILEGETIEIQGMPGRIITANAVVKEQPTEIVAVFFFNDKRDEIGFVSLSQTSKASKDYKQVFLDMVYPSGLPAEIKESLLVKVGEAKAQAAKEEAARKAAEEEAARKAEAEAAKKAEEEAARKAAEEEKARKAAEAEEEKARLADWFPVDDARRAATVALTNATAYDVYASDGNTHDPSLYHSYSDRSGCYLELLSDGSWTPKDGSTWHVSNIRYRVGGFDTEVKASLDVSFDGEYYWISNVTGMMAIPGKESIGTNLKTYSEWQPDGFEAFTVPSYLLG